jgi:hypothetical protein
MQHEQRLPLFAQAFFSGLLVFLPPRLQLATPNEKFTLVLQPVFQGRPRLEQHFVCDLGGDLAIFFAADDQSPVRLGEFLRERPFGIRSSVQRTCGIALPTRAHWFALARDVGESQRE